MKTISTPVVTLLTGSEIADAVLRYGLALARAHRMDVVDIPVLLDGDTIRRTQFIIGWAAQTAVTTEVLPQIEELYEPATVIDLLDRAEMVGVHKACPFTAGELENLPGLDLDF